MTSMTQDLNIFLKFFWFFFVLLVTSELISHYPKIDSSQWLKKYVQWISDKVFREKLML